MILMHNKAIEKVLKELNTSPFCVSEDLFLWSSESVQSSFINKAKLLPILTLIRACSL
jgi:hypothetical protein